jgi:uncharacterized protein
MKVFDLHIHVQPWDMLRPGAYETLTRARSDLDEIRRIQQDPEELLRHMDAEKIERAALINYVAPEVMGFTPETVRWVSRYTARHRDRLYPVGSVHPGHSSDVAADTRRMIEDQGIRMVKIHPPHQLFAANAHLDLWPSLALLYRTCEELHVPVMIHSGTSIFPGARNRFADPMAVDDVAVDFPHLRIVLAHSGRPLHTETAVFLARRHPNVWLELSGIPPRKLLDYLPRLSELADRTLWGTDWPSPGVRSMGQNVKDFEALPISDEAKRKILWDNALRLFGETDDASGGPARGRPIV